MAIYMIGYDLNHPGQNYPNLINAIKSHNSWCHVLESTWLIKVSSTSSALDVANNLLQFMDSNDELFVSEITQNTAWARINTEVVRWIQDNL